MGEMHSKSHHRRDGFRLRNPTKNVAGKKKKGGARRAMTRGRRAKVHNTQRTKNDDAAAPRPDDFFGSLGCVSQRLPRRLPRFHQGWDRKAGAWERGCRGPCSGAPTGEAPIRGGVRAAAARPRRARSAGFSDPIPVGGPERGVPSRATWKMRANVDSHHHSPGRQTSDETHNYTYECSCGISESGADWWISRAGYPILRRRKGGAAWRARRTYFDVDELARGKASSEE